MAISAELLSEGGKLVYIVPRSFASGPYFRRFREVFFGSVVPTAIHLFESRKDVFRNQTVLQENLIIAARNRMDGEPLDDGQVVVSHSKAAHDLDERRQLLVDVGSVLDMTSENREPVHSQLFRGLGAGAGRALLAQYAPLARPGSLHRTCRALQGYLAIPGPRRM